MSKANTLPKPVPVLPMDKDDPKVSVLLTLLEQNREEIRYWNEKMFQAAFALDSAIVVVAAFALDKEHMQDKPLLWLAIAACALFAAFHVVVGAAAANAIGNTARDLEKIQAALHLCEPNEFVEAENKESAYIYKWTGRKWRQQTYYLSLHLLNLLLASGVIVFLVSRIKG